MKNIVNNKELLKKEYLNKITKMILLKTEYDKGNIKVDEYQKTKLIIKKSHI